MRVTILENILTDAKGSYQLPHKGNNKALPFSYRSWSLQLVPEKVNP